MRDIFNLVQFELRRKIKSTIIWVLSWSAITYLFVHLFNSLEFGDLEEVILETFPEQMLEIFNINPSYFTHIEGFLGGEFMFLYLLSGMIYALFAGASSIGKKITEKTILQLLTKRLSRSALYFSFLMTNVLNLTILTSLTMLAVYSISVIGVDQADPVSFDFYFSLFTTMLILKIYFFNFGQALGILLEHTRANAIGILFVLASWLINGISTMDGFPIWMKYLSPFNYANLAYVTNNYAVDWHNSYILLSASLLLGVIGVLIFRRKNIYI